MSNKSYLDFLNQNRQKPKSVSGRLHAALKEAFNDDNIGYGLESEQSGIFTGAMDESSSGMQTLSKLQSDAESALEALCQSGNFKDQFGEAPTELMKDAFTDATLRAQNPAMALAALRNRRLPESRGSVHVIQTSVEDEAELLEPSNESFAEEVLRSTTLYAMQLSLRPGNQDEFSNAFFPPTIVPTDQAGLSISLPVVQLQDNALHDINGASVDFKRKALVWARINPDLMRDDDTKLIPIFRDSNKHMFVDEADLRPRTVKQMGGEVDTSALKVGQKFNILGLSQSDAQIARNGAADIRDSVASGSSIEALILKVGEGADAEVFRLETTGVDTTTFYDSPQGSSQLSILSLDTRALTLRPGLKKADQTASALFAALETHRITLGLHVELNGKLDVELGEGSTSAPSVSVWNATQASIDGRTSVELGLNDANVKDLVELVSKAQIIGFVFDGYRRDAGRRNEGQLLNNFLYTQIHATKRRAPLSVLTPQVGTVEAREATDIAAIMEGIGTRTNIAAVAALHRHFEILRNNVSQSDMLGARPNILGIAASTIKPFVLEGEIDMLKELQTLNSTDKLRDICNVYMNAIRDLVYQAYQESGYKATADARFGGKSPKPLVIIGSDTRNAAYMQVIGDQRALGDGFDFEIVSTLNQTMTDVIYITFGVREALTSGQPEPLHFGTLAWSTPQVYSLPTPKGGAHNTQTTAQPDFIHFCNLPVLIKLKIRNLDKAIRMRTPVGVVEKDASGTP